jgi:tetratricopeptide (TPR) repeat protein
LELCAFLAPDIPRSLLVEHAEVLPAELAEVAGDLLRFNDTVRVLTRYSLQTATPTSLGLHRLVQAVIRARLGKDAKRHWAQAAVALLRNAFPSTSWELETWPACQQLLPHVLAAIEHAQRLSIAGEQPGWLLYRASAYLEARGQYQEAKPLAERALILTRKALGDDYPDVSDRHDGLGRILQGLGDYRGAKQQYEEALRIAEANKDRKGFRLGILHSHLGLVLHELRDLDGARTEHERALEIGRATIGPDHLDMAARHNNLGNVLGDLGDWDGARTELERALEIGQATLGANHPDMPIFRRNLDQVLQQLGGQ